MMIYQLGYKENTMKDIKIQLTDSDWNDIEIAIEKVLIKHLGVPNNEDHPVFQLQESQFCYTAEAGCIDTFNYLLKISN